jgi:hypothetical protein
MYRSRTTGQHRSTRPARPGQLQRTSRRRTMAPVAQHRTVSHQVHAARSEERCELLKEQLLPRRLAGNDDLEPDSSSPRPLNPAPREPLSAQPRLASPASPRGSSSRPRVQRRTLHLSPPEKRLPRPMGRSPDVVGTADPLKDRIGARAGRAGRGPPAVRDPPCRLSLPREADNDPSRDAAGW